MRASNTFGNTRASQNREPVSFRCRSCKIREHCPPERRAHGCSGPQQQYCRVRDWEIKESKRLRLLGVLDEEDDNGADSDNDDQHQDKDRGHQ